MATLEQLETALRNADKAGDVAAAQMLASEIVKVRNGSQSQGNAAPAAGFMDTVAGFTPYGATKNAIETMKDPMGALQSLDDTARLAASGLSFGFIDKLAGTTEGGTEAARARTQAARDRQGARGMAVEVGASVLPAARLAQAGVTAARLPGMVGKYGGMALDGAAYGALQAAGNDQDIARGAAGGLVAGAATQGGVKLASAAMRPFAAYVNPDKAAARAIDRSMQSANMTPWQIEDDLARAADDGQGGFAVMDAMGLPGQRLTSTVARSPGQGRTAIVEALEKRQAGQGRRIANTLSEGFGDPATALQKTEAMKAARKTGGDVNYTAAREGAKAVNTSTVISKIDERLGRVTPKFSDNPFIARAQAKQFNAKNLNDDGLASDSIDSALSKVRSMLVGGQGNQRINFNKLLTIRSDIDDMASSAFSAGKNKQGTAIKDVVRELDAALADASSGYRKALEQYAKDSKVIEAVDTGRNAAMRGRFEDTIPAFGKMTPEEQAAYRAGYADPLIAQTQQSPVGVNKARPLINDATAAEFPAFAAPGQADKLGRRISREQTMFETRNAALGGSKTADNLADEADLASFDPSIIGSLLQGNFVGAGRNALVRMMTSLKGQPEAVRDRIAKALMETNPQKARALLEKNAYFAKQSKSNQDAIIRALMLGSISGMTLTKN